MDITDSIKNRVESNAAKLGRPVGYLSPAKERSVLRIETTINDPREFKVYATVHHNDGTESKEWKPMDKSISNLYRYGLFCCQSTRLLYISLYFLIFSQGNIIGYPQRKAARG